MSQCRGCLIVSSSLKWTLLTSMSTIELVDPELRDALALWPLQPLTADTLTKRRADLLKVIGTVQTPNSA